MTVDRNPMHLYPVFRTPLLTTIKELNAETGLSWGIMEGLRSTPRQLWLYAQGRTRPGPVVTWLRNPRFHGAGLAADLCPAKDGKPWYQAPRSYWEALRKTGKKHGLVNPAWHKGDLGHLQWHDAGLCTVALAWVRAGCPNGHPATPLPEIPCLVNGKLVPDADARLLITPSGQRLFVWTRAVLEVAGWAITRVVPGAVFVLPPRGEYDDVCLSISKINGRAFATAEQFDSLGWAHQWQHDPKQIRFTTPVIVSEKERP